MPDKNKHKIGLAAATSYVIGCMVGSGIFITPTSILLQTGSVGLSLLIWAVGGLISIFGALSYVELGTSITESGCDYAYLMFVGWKPVAFAFIWINVLVQPCAMAIVAETFGEYIMQAFTQVYCLEPLARRAAQKLFAFSLMWFLTWTNFYSLKRYMGPFQVVMMIGKLTPMLVIICTGFYYLFFEGWNESFDVRSVMAGSNFAPKNLVLALYAGLWPYSGWECLNFGAEEIKNPKRTFPLAIVGGCLIVTVFYVAVNVAYFAVLGKDGMLESHAIAATFAAKVLGILAHTVPVVMGIVMVGTENTFLFMASRYFFATSRKGHFPAMLSVVSPESGSPRVAVFATTFLGIAISLLIGNLDMLINVYSFCVSFQRIFTMLAVLWIRYKRMEVNKNAVRMPIFIHVTFLLICVFLTVIPIIQETKVAVSGLGATFFGLIAYFVITNIHIPDKIKRFNVRSAEVAGAIFLCSKSTEEEDNESKELDVQLNGKS